MAPGAKKAAKKAAPKKAAPPVKKAVQKGGAAKDAAKKVNISSPKRQVESVAPLKGKAKAAKVKTASPTKSLKSPAKSLKSPAKLSKSPPKSPAKLSKSPPKTSKSPKSSKAPKTPKSVAAKISKTPKGKASKTPKAKLGDAKTTRKAKHATPGTSKSQQRRREACLPIWAAPVVAKPVDIQPKMPQFPHLSEKVMSKVTAARLQGAWALLPEASGRPVVVKPQRNVSVGRHRDSYIRLEDRRISVYHAELRLLFLTNAQRTAKTPGLYLRSLSDNNPCRLNGAKVRTWTQIHAGESVEFVPGLSFYAMPPKEKPAPAPAPAAPARAEPQHHEAQYEPPQMRARRGGEEGEDEVDEEEWESDTGVCGYCFCDNHTSDACPHAAGHVKSRRIESALMWKGFLGPKSGGVGDRHSARSYI